MTPPEVHLTDREARFGRRIAMYNMSLFALLAAGQWLVWTGIPTYDSGDGVGFTTVRTLAVFGVSLGLGLLAVLVVYLSRGLVERRLVAFTVVWVCTGLAAAVARAFALAHVDPTPVGARSLVVLSVVGCFSYVVALGTAIVATGLVLRYRDANSARRAEEKRAAQAVATMEAEELRVRQMVADTLHGTIQNRLVVVGVALEELADEMAESGDDGWARSLRGWADDLDRLREEDVRAVSHALFPTGANIGTFEAIRLLVDRLPPSIATTVDLGPGARALAADPSTVPVPIRLTVVYAIEEAVTNALKHGARSVRVAIEARRDGERGTWRLEVTVDDDGTGLATAAPVLHGLERHRVRIETCGGTMSLGDGPLGGARLRLALPFDPVVPET